MLTRGSPVFCQWLKRHYFDFPVFLLLVPGEKRSGMTMAEVVEIPKVATQRLPLTQGIDLRKFDNRYRSHSHGRVFCNPNQTGMRWSKECHRALPDKNSDLRQIEVRHQVLTLQALRLLTTRVPMTKTEHH